MTAARVAVPAGTVPSLRAFMKHVWRYRDENGHTALTAPPEVFTLVVDAQTDMRCAESAVALLSGPLGFEQRVRFRPSGPARAEVGFADLIVLHAFLQALSIRDGEDPIAREMAEFCLEILGFKWT